MQLPMMDSDYYRRQLETVAENATLALFIMDEQQQCTYMNPAAERLTGFTLAELQGKALHYYVHHTRPDGTPYPLEECPIDQAFPQNMREQGEEVFVHKDGHLYPVAFTASPIRQGGRPVGTIIEARDVTEEKAREAARRRAEERYRFLAETIPAQAWTALPDGRLDYVSRRTARYFGVPAEQVLEDGWQEVLHPEDLPRAVDRWVRSLTTGEPYEVEFRLRRADGEYRWHLARADAMRADSGEITSWFGVNFDVHDRKMLEAERDAALRAAELGRERLTTVFQSAPALIAVLRGPELVYEVVNPLYQEFFRGRTLLGRPMREALPELEGQGFFEMLDGVRATGETVVGNETPALLDRNGDGILEEGFFNFVFQALSETDGTVSGILVHAVDVTAQVCARREVEQKAEELARASRALEASNRELDQFAYVASHDLKAPLRGIASLATWIEEDIGGEINPEVRTHIDLLRSRVHRMEGLIDGILQYSRAGRVHESPTRVDTGELAREVAELIAPPEHVRIRIGEDLPVVWTERLPLQQVFMNLLGNAVKYAQAEEPRVELSARDAGEHWEFAVSDNGPGIAPEYHERIFGIFQMLEARDKVEGTGIGLSIVKKLVESRGGKVWVESEQGAGSTFRFLLPKMHEGAERSGDE